MPDVLDVRDVDEPVPKGDEVLLRVYAASVNDWDWGLLRGAPFTNRLLYGLWRPRKTILGSDVAGRIEAVGENAMRFRPGDEVYGDLSGQWGGFAEYVCARESSLAPKPAGMTFEEAAALPQAVELAIQGLRAAGRIQPGQRLLINGAGGGVGTFGVQIAKLDGAEVTGVDGAGKLDLLRSLGFGHVIDYAQEDFTRSGQRYDLILDVKTNRPLFAYLRALRRGGTYVTVGGSLARLLEALLLGPWISMITGKRIRVVGLKPNKNLDFVNELYEAGKIRPVIDGPYELTEVPELLRYFGRGEHKGKIVITVRRDDGLRRSASHGGG